MTTDNNTAPVDVLAVMEQTIEREKSAGQAYVAQEAARAAVAELIAADDEYNRAREAWLASPALHEEFQATRDAWKRRAAALARVKGESA